MGRKKEPVWEHFKDHPQGGYKFPRAQCIHCSITVSAAPKNMRNHLSSCGVVPSVFGRVLVAESIQAAQLDRRTEATEAKRNMATQLQAKVYPSFNREERQALDQSFASAVHETGAAFSTFEHPSWKRFFDLLHLPWSPPSTAELSTTLLTSTYEDIMSEVTEALRKAPAITIGVDGATNVLSRSMSNVIAHDPRPWFVEYLRADLKKESAPEVTKKIADAVSRIHGYIQHEAVFAFVSDSCNLMRAVRSTLETENVVAFGYGCSAHALNNFCEDIVKMSGVKAFVRNAVFLCKTVKNQGLLNKIYSVLCVELLKRDYTMVLYSPSRWSSVNYMFTRLAKVKRPMTAVVTAVMNERTERGIDDSYTLPSGYSDVVMDPQFWRNVDWNVAMFDPICKCIGVLESNSATMATTYACFVYVYLHATEHFTGEDLPKKLLHRWGRIQSPVHALAFFCDPFFRPMRVAVSRVHGAQALELGKGDLSTQCRCAINLLCRQDVPDYQTQAMREFMDYCVKEDAIAQEWSPISEFQPQQIWTQGRSKFPVLSELLVKLYASPASTAGVERQHKVGKHVHSSTRNRMSAGKVEEQAAIVHNSAVLKMDQNPQRQRFEHRIVSDIVKMAAEHDLTGSRDDAADAEVEPDAFAELTEEEIQEQEVLNAALASMASPQSIPDTLLFPVRDECGRDVG